MWPSLKPSQRVQVAGVIPPQSAETTLTTGWVNAANWENFLAAINVGAISAGGTVNAQLNQATTNTGTGSKVVTNVAGDDLAIAPMTQAAPNSDELALINCNAADLDTNNGFTWIELEITITGAAALVSAELLGFDPKVPTADSTGNGSDASAVAQIVS